MTLTPPLHFHNSQRLMMTHVAHFKGGPLQSVACARWDAFSLSLSAACALREQLLLHLLPL